MKKTILTGDRPTGALHLGHYVGSLRKRVEMQNTGDYNQFILIADLQALTDNAENPEKIRQNILEVMLDYLAVGLDPEKSTFVIQSTIPALFELPMYYSNLVTMARLERNPTIKTEIQLRNFQRDIPVGFMTYPISQAADITAFKADFVPVGNDQLPMIEQTRDIVSSFNRIYKEVLVEPKAILPDNEVCYRLVGTDGNAKMSKSLNNCIYLKDEADVLKKKVMGMFTDPNHLRVEDPGQVEGNPVFIYLDVFCTDELFSKYCTDYANLGEMKAHYQRGGLGDVKVKRLLNDVLQDILSPIRERRKYYEDRKPEILEILKNGTEKALEVTNKTLNDVRNAIGINYFSDDAFEKQYINKK
ncbi:MAG: tryptophan--tRNA ligase [Dysgonomonas sp.]